MAANNSASEIQPATHYALQVALQTMKERCVSLQRRLTALEEENQQLKESNANTQPGTVRHTTSGAGGSADVLQLRCQVADLQRQKEQLNEHIALVSNENRKLWSRLSQLAKEHDLEKDLEQQGGASPRQSNQNLIRSKTFTQHSPNPHLRQKVISHDITSAAPGGMQDISLEEVTLGKGGDDYGTLGFSYLSVEGALPDAVKAVEDEMDEEAKKCFEGMQQMREEVLQQRKQLDTALTMLESRIALHPCPECAKNTATQKPQMADKSLETDDSLQEIKFFNNNQRVNGPDAAHGQSILNGFTNTEANEATTPNTNTHLDIIQEKIRADSQMRSCPMCGRIFSTVISFDTFQEHVEAHFVDENSSSDLEMSLERNFELISHTVGDF